VEFFEGVLQMDTVRYYQLALAYKFYYGNWQTGRSWEQIDVGYIAWGANGGLVCLPNEKAKTGPNIRIGAIVKIEDAAGTVVYRHPTFHTPQETPPKVVEKRDEGRALRRVALKRHGQEGNEGAKKLQDA
jgi:hypothetical protein